MQPNAEWTLPPAQPGTNRTLYLFAGAARIADKQLKSPIGLRLVPDAGVPLAAGPDGAEVLVLQARPIGEPVVQHGPFVMNTVAEIRQAIADFQSGAF